MSHMNNHFKYAKNIEGVLKNFSDSKEFSIKNKIAVKKFIDDCSARNLSNSRLIKLIMCLQKILRLTEEDFDLLEAKKEDLKDLVRRINTANKENGEPIAESYKIDLKACLKQFYKIMQPTEDEDCPSKAKWIPTTLKNNLKTIPHPLTKNDVEKMIDAAQNDRMRCMIKLLDESGVRVGELLGMRIRDVEFTDSGVKIEVNGKTGPRKILVIQSERYLRVWLSHHPYKTERNAPLWVKLEQRSKRGAEDNRIEYGSFRVLLQRIAIRADVRTYKRDGKIFTEVHPHLFRHTAASRLATDLSESVMKEYFGWKQSSNMTQIYIHLNGKQVDAEILKANGIKISENKEEIQECPRCFRTNKNAEFCSRCGMPLTLKAANQKEEIKSEIQSIVSIMIEHGITKEELNEVL